MWSLEVSVTTDNDEDECGSHHSGDRLIVTTVSISKTTGEITTCTWSTAKSEPSLSPVQWPTASSMQSTSENVSSSSSAVSTGNGEPSQQQDHVNSPVQAFGETKKENVRALDLQIPSFAALSLSNQNRSVYELAKEIVSDSEDGESEDGGQTAESTPQKKDFCQQVTDPKVTHSRHVMPDLISTDDEWPGTLWMDEKNATPGADAIRVTKTSSCSAKVTTVLSHSCPSTKSHDGVFVDSFLGKPAGVTSIISSPSHTATPSSVRLRRQNTFVRRCDAAVAVTQSTSVVQAQVAYAPTPCGCFYNKHSLTHMLGLCRLPIFRKKCKHRGVSKHKDCVYALYTPKLQVRGHGSLRGVPSTREKMPAFVRSRPEQKVRNTARADDAEKRNSASLSTTSSRTVSGKKCAKSNLEAVTRQLSEIDYGFNPTFASSSLPKEAFLSLRKEKHRRHCRADSTAGVDISSGKSSGFWTTKFKSFSRGSKTKLSAGRRTVAGCNRPGRLE